jgi:Lon protease-like protein
MDIEGEHDLRDFANVCRLFPLPRVVLFPHAVLPIHIFEPRYRQMTEDALADNKLLTIVQWRVPHLLKSLPLPTATGVEPALEEIACLGRILQHERLADGRFNLLLLGRKRVRLGSEIQGHGKLYRIAEAEILEDEVNDLPQEPRAHEIIRLFRQVFDRQGATDFDLGNLLGSGMPLGPLTDLVAHALGLPPAIKQQLLGERCVDRRAEQIATILRRAASPESSGADELPAFPPPFSEN